MELKEQPLLNFLGCRIKSVEFKINTEIPKEELQHNLEVSMNTIHNFEENEQEFSTDFTLTVINELETIKLTIIAVAYFKTTSIINEEFIKSNFIKVSVPAIVFPYLRSFVSTLTVNSGINPIVLPTFNFANIDAKENNSEQ